MVQKVISRTSQGENLFSIFNDLNINAIDFMQFLENNPQIAEKFDISIRLYIERIIFNSFNSIDMASDKLELDKVAMKLRGAQWLAERRVSKVYAARQEINVNQTIDIRQALQLADSRVAKVIDCTVNNREDSISLNDDMPSNQIDTANDCDDDILG